MIKLRRWHVIALAIIIIVVIYGIIRGAYTNVFLFIISSLVNIVGYLMSKNRKSIGGIALSVYYFLFITMQYAFSYILPDSLVSTRFNPYYEVWLFERTDLLIKYFFMATLFYCVGLCICFFVDISGVYKVMMLKNGVLIKHPFFLTFVFAVLHTYNSLYLTNGYIDYALKGLGIFCLGQITVKYTRGKFKLKNIVCLVIGLLLYSFPGLVKGRRGYLINGILLILVYLLITNIDYIKSFVKKHKTLCVISIIGAVLFYEATTYIKLGTFVATGKSFILYRLTGLFDGLVALDYMMHNQVHLDAMNYIMAAVNDSGVRANYYYTHEIIGYPEGVAHSNALPGFIGSMFYGKIGWFVVMVLLIGLFAFACSKIRYLKKKSNENSSVNNGIVIYIYIYLLILVFENFFMDGNIEILKSISVPFFAWILAYFFSLKNKIICY